MMPDVPDDVRGRMIAAYALRCSNEGDLATFMQYLDQYSRELIAGAVSDLLMYLGIDQEVEVEVIHLTEEQRTKLEQAGMLDDYLNDRGKDDYDS